jgi:hypothetical protein
MRTVVLEAAIAHLLITVSVKSWLSTQIPVASTMCSFTSTISSLSSAAMRAIMISPTMLFRGRIMLRR